MNSFGAQKVTSSAGIAHMEHIAVFVIALEATVRSANARLVRHGLVDGWQAEYVVLVVLCWFDIYWSFTGAEDAFIFGTIFTYNCSILYRNLRGNIIAQI